MRTRRSERRKVRASWVRDREKKRRGEAINQLWKFSSPNLILTSRDSMPGGGPCRGVLLLLLVLLLGTVTSAQVSATFTAMIRSLFQSGKVRCYITTITTTTRDYSLRLQCCDYAYKLYSHRCSFTTSKPRTAVTVKCARTLGRGSFCVHLISKSHLHQSGTRRNFLFLLNF